MACQCEVCLRFRALKARGVPDYTKYKFRGFG